MQNYTSNQLLAIGYGMVGFCCGVVAFGAAWWGCILWGGFLGMLLGWIPALIAAVLAFYLGPLAIGIVLLFWFILQF